MFDYGLLLWLLMLTLQIRKTSFETNMMQVPYLVTLFQVQLGKFEQISACTAALQQTELKIIDFFLKR